MPDFRAVIDKNRFESEELDRWLSLSPNHKAVITDYAQMECYKGDGQRNLTESIKVISRYQGQIVLLKPTSENSRVRPRPIKKLQDKFIDRTTDLSSFFTAVRLANLGNEIAIRQIEEHSDKANAFFCQITNEMNLVSTGIRDVIRVIDVNALRIFRKERVFAPKLVRAMCKMINELFRYFSGKSHYENNKRSIQLVREINTFPFRYAICCCAYVIICAENGDGSQLSLKVLANDIVDINYATYATIFDGFMTRDEKAKAIWETAAWIIDGIAQSRTNGPAEEALTSSVPPLPDTPQKS